VRRYYAFPDAITRATKESVALGGFIFEHLGRLFTGEAAFEKSVGGPVEMVRQAAIAAEEGIFHWARLMGGLSISLGIINFLPVPVLDGGQFLFYLLEGIRGRPLSLALRERAQQVGVLMIVLLMLTVLVTDIHRLIGSRRVGLASRIDTARPWSGCALGTKSSSGRSAWSGADGPSATSSRTIAISMRSG
jgi:regulator of sigma E protease